MKIEQNSRQMPASRETTKEKDYCDLLYAWLQCHSERASAFTKERRVHKSLIKWVSIERDFTRIIDGREEKAMARKTIAKYFNWLEEQGYVQLRDEYYYLTLLDDHSGFLVEFRTLEKLMNCLQRRSLSIYIYLLNRYIANGYEGYYITLGQIKDFIGLTTNTSSNNSFIVDNFDIFKRLGLLDYDLKYENGRYNYLIKWVKNTLPNLD